ncbi:MAG: EAL domain-containing protein [Lachnospiraceae bacterium]|nr:EAL domain-containing protein [Lachnospiraceae bacterium]
MEHYNVYFEIASAAVLIIMIALMKIKKQLNILRDKLFFGGLIMVLLLNVGNILRGVIINNHCVINGYEVPAYAIYGVTIFCLLMQQLASIQLVYYVYAALDTKRAGKILTVLLTILCLVYAGLVVSTPWTGLVITLGDDARVIEGSYSFIRYSVPSVCILYASMLIMSKRKRLSIFARMSLSFFCLSTYAVMLIQGVLLQNTLIVYFWITLCILNIFLTIQSPDYFLDRATNTFNSDGLRIMMNDCLERKKNFSMLLIAVQDFEGIKDGFSQENKRRVYSCICSEIMKSQYITRRKGNDTDHVLYLENANKKKKTINVFRDDDKIYVMYYDVPSAEQNSIDIGTWVTEGIHVEGVEKPVKIVAKMLLFDCPGDVRSEEEFNSVIKYFLTDDYYNQLNVLNSVNDEFFRKKLRYENVRGLVEEAIRTEGIDMYYQPIFSTERGDFHSSEALVRLKDNQSNGFVSPEEFIRIAEKEHLILQLEEIILRKICKFISKSKLKSLGVDYVEVNLSGNQCVQRDLYIQLQDLMDEYHIPPSFINFEVTETSQIADSKALKNNMAEMKKYGSNFSLDDYGSGASNLEYLVDYPFSIVKLDKSIVWTHFRSNSEKTRAILPYSVKMLREMGVDIVAEGVEYEQEVKGLAQMGVQYLQGYYFSKPICEKDYIKFLKKHHAEKLKEQ